MDVERTFWKTTHMTPPFMSCWTALGHKSMCLEVKKKGLFAPTKYEADGWYGQLAALLLTGQEPFGRSLVRQCTAGGWKNTRTKLGEAP